MALKYVVDEETGYIKANEEGLPLVVDDSKEDAEPYGLDGISLYAKVPSLQREAKDRRKELRTAQQELEAFKELELDLDEFPEWKEKATKALETVQNLDDQKLIEANKVEEMKEQVRQQIIKEKNQVEKQYKDMLKEKEEALETTTKQVRELVVDNQFFSSNYINDSLVVTPKMARKIFGDNFKVETIDNKTMAVGYVDDEPIMSKSNIGQYASFDESLKAMVEADSDKDAYIKVDPKKTKQEPQTPVSFQAATAPERNRNSVDKIRAGLTKLSNT